MSDSPSQGVQLHFASEVTYFATQYADASPLKLDQLKLTAMMLQGKIRKTHLIFRELLWWDGRLVDLFEV